MHSMPRIEIETLIKAPPARCFDLSRSIELHVASAGPTRERPVAGRMSGLIGAGEQVTWRARHFGVWQELTSRIVQFAPPHHFRDSMVSGAFRGFDHDHHFDVHADGTLMRDVFDYSAPLGPLGAIAESLFLTAYMRRFLDERCAVIKSVAESDAWTRYITDAASAP
jgi:ligand-binding SRPBCC domain-containing protein